MERRRIRNGRGNALRGAEGEIGNEMGLDKMTGEKEKRKKTREREREERRKGNGKVIVLVEGEVERRRRKEERGKEREYRKERLSGGGEEGKDARMINGGEKRRLRGK